MSKRILLIGLIALSMSSTGCFPRIRQCIANRWHAHHPYAGGACCAPVCAPAFKVPAQACCGNELGSPIGYPVVMQPQAGVPTIGNPMPLPGSSIPGPMPGKN